MRKKLSFMNAFMKSCPVPRETNWGVNLALMIHDKKNLMLYCPFIPPKVYNLFLPREVSCKKKSVRKVDSVSINILCNGDVLYALSRRGSIS